MYFDFVRGGVFAVNDSPLFVKPYGALPFAFALQRFIMQGFKGACVWQAKLLNGFNPALELPFDVEGDFFELLFNVFGKINAVFHRHPLLYSMKQTLLFVNYIR